jgi:hypothetical protein
MSLAGMEPAGAVRHRRSPEGVSFREKANQSNLRFALPLSWPTLWPFELCPWREYVRREPRRIDEARRVSERVRANQSNLRSALPLSLATLRRVAKCPRREWSRWEASDIDEAPKG